MVGVGNARQGQGRNGEIRLVCERRGRGEKSQHFLIQATPQSSPCFENSKLGGPFRACTLELLVSSLGFVLTLFEFAMQESAIRVGIKQIGGGLPSIACESPPHTATQQNLF